MLAPEDWGHHLGLTTRILRIKSELAAGPVHSVKPVRTPVAIFGSLRVCIYGPASRHWLISYSPIHLT